MEIGIAIIMGLGLPIIIGMGLADSTLAALTLHLPLMTHPQMLEMRILALLTGMKEASRGRGVLGVRITRAWRRTLRCWASSRRYAGRTRVRAPLLPCNCFNCFTRFNCCTRLNRLTCFGFNRSCFCPPACRRQRQLLERGGEPGLLVEEFKPVMGHRVNVQDNLPGPAPRNPAGE